MRIKVKGVKQISIKDEFIRLDALMKYASIATTGGEAKILIQSVDVLVDGKPCLMRGKKIRPSNVVRFEGNTILVKNKTNNTASN